MCACFKSFNLFLEGKNDICSRVTQRIWVMLKPRTWSSIWISHPSTWHICFCLPRRSSRWLYSKWSVTESSTHNDTPECDARDLRNSLTHCAIPGTPFVFFHLISWSDIFKWFYMQGFIHIYICCAHTFTHTTTFVLR